MSIKRVYPREEYCMGCRLCEVACITVHSESGDTIKAYKKEFPREPSRIWFEEKKPECFSFMCRHCDEPDCLEACISGAITKDSETGIVTIDEDICVGCWSCIMACPYGALKKKVRKDNKMVSTKCDLCIGRGVNPACVQACPNRALVFK